MKQIKDFIYGFRDGFKNFSENITTIINTVLLSIVYFIGIGITALIARIFKKRFLDVGIKQKSYWSDLNLTNKDNGEYYRQF